MSAPVQPVPATTPATYGRQRGAYGKQATTPGAQSTGLTLAAPATDTASTVATPNTSLLNTTITGPTTDRLSLAQQDFNTYTQATDPAYQKAIRDATSAAASKGQLGSGQLRTSYGDLALARANDLDTQKQSFLTAAENGQIADEQANTAIQQQQQQFQATQAQNATQNALSAGSLTGTYNGGPTLAAQQAAEANALNTAGLTGTLNGQQTLAAKSEADQAALSTAGLTGSLNGQQTLGAQQLTLAQQEAQNQNTLATAAQTGTLNGQSTLAGQQLTLAQQQAQSQDALAKAGLTGSLDGQSTLAGQQLTLAQQEAQSQNALAQAGLTGTLNGQQTLASQQLAQQGSQFEQNLTAQQQQQQQANTIATGNLSLAQKSEADSNANASAALEQSGTQFNQNLAQNLTLANQANTTQNKSIDASTAQGKANGLVQLLQTIGLSTSAFSPAVLAAIEKAFGVDPGSVSTSGTTGTPVGGDPTSGVVGDPSDPLGDDGDQKRTDSASLSDPAVQQQIMQFTQGLSPDALQSLRSAGLPV